jgi:hypothetical protein
MIMGGIGFIFSVIGLVNNYQFIVNLFNGYIPKPKMSDFATDFMGWVLIGTVSVSFGIWGFVDWRKNN